MALKIENGRGILHCERCATQIDLGPELQVRIKLNNNALRYPTGWLQIGETVHLCPLHSQGMIFGKTS